MRGGPRSTPPPPLAGCLLRISASSDFKAIPGVARAGWPLKGIYRSIVFSTVAVLLLAVPFVTSSAQVFGSSNALVPHGSHPRVSFGPSTSTNWSGYAVTASTGSVTVAKGSWIVPTASCSGSSTDTYAAVWVGIDGYSSSTVEQIGTDSDCQNGSPVYYAWYEFYPHPSYLISALTSVSPGNSIVAGVSYSGNVFTVTITDTTTGQSYTTSSTVSSAQRNSAEWILEAPSSSNNGNILPLTNFGTEYNGMDYSGASATDYATIGSSTGPISSFGSSVQQITMVSSGGSTEAQPSALSSDGTSYSEQYVGSGSSTTSTTSSGTSVLTIDSVNTNGQAISGYWTVLYNGAGSTVSTGYTPASFTLNNGQPYSVEVDSYGSCNFAYWADNTADSTDPRPVTITGNTVLTAVYNCGSTSTSSSTTTSSTTTSSSSTTTSSTTSSSSTTTSSSSSSTSTTSSAASITVKSVNQNGVAITGYWTVLYNKAGSVLQTGYTPKVFSGLTAGTTYQVELDSYGSCTFQHWQDTGSTNPLRTYVATSGSQTLVGVYSCTS